MERGDEALSGRPKQAVIAAINAVIARLDRATQYAVTPVVITSASGILGHPLSRVVTTEFVDAVVAP
jgi:hypothetical protein